MRFQINAIESTRRPPRSLNCYFSPVTQLFPSAEEARLGIDSEGTNITTRRAQNVSGKVGGTVPSLANLGTISFGCVRVGPKISFPDWDRLNWLVIYDCDTYGTKWWIDKSERSRWPYIIQGRIMGWCDIWGYRGVPRRLHGSVFWKLHPFGCLLLRGSRRLMFRDLSEKWHGHLSSSVGSWGTCVKMDEWTW